MSEEYFEQVTVPNNREAELACIGSVLIDPECMDELELSSKEFYVHRNRYIWEAFEYLRSADTPIDFLTVCSHLTKVGRMEEVGGEGYITDLINQTPTSMHAPAYAKLVKQEAENREYLSIGNLLADGAYKSNVDVATIIDRLIKAKNVEGGSGNITESIRKMDENVQERIANPCKVWGIPTGLLDFDTMTGGLHRQQSMLLIGPPEVGKTTLALQIGIDIATIHKRHVAIYELEMDEERLLHRGIFMLGGPSPRKLKSGFFEPADYTTYLNALGMLDSPYLHICDNPMLTTSMLRADLAKLRSKFDIELVILDYMDLLADTDGTSENERSRNRSKRCRAIYREANVSGISIQSLNKAGIEKAVADIQDMSGPSGNGYDADWIFTLSKGEIDNTIRMIQVKGRDAEGKCNIDLLRRGLRFYNVKKEEPKKKEQKPTQVPYWNKD